MTSKWRTSQEMAQDIAALIQEMQPIETGSEIEDGLVLFERSSGRFPASWKLVPIRDLPYRGMPRALVIFVGELPELGIIESGGLIADLGRRGFFACDLSTRPARVVEFQRRWSRTFHPEALRLLELAGSLGLLGEDGRARRNPGRNQ